MHQQSQVMVPVVFLTSHAPERIFAPQLAVSLWSDLSKWASPILGNGSDSLPHIPHTRENICLTVSGDPPQ
jgi:hypothetical protein